MAFLTPIGATLTIFEQKSAAVRYARKFSARAQQYHLHPRPTIPARRIDLPGARKTCKVRSKFLHSQTGIANKHVGPRQSSWLVISQAFEVARFDRKSSPILLDRPHPCV